LVVEREWSLKDCLDENLFNDYTQLNQFHQYSNIIQFKFKNGNFRTQISIRDNFKKFKKRLINNFYIGKDVIIGDIYGNEYNLYNTVMPIKDEIWLHILIRDNLNNTTTKVIAELKETKFNIKTMNGRFNFIAPYFTGWNVDAIKCSINMLSGANDKEVTVKINNLFCDFDETIESVKGVFSINGNMKQMVRTYTKSLAIPFFY
jgi:hypothetical protein